MIKVLIVDDDQLVRKGLIYAMPWSDFDMKVVGEASNGKKALDFLGNDSVDLIISDLNMPVMSGIEFMRLARQRYPKVFIAVLTLHQDFEYIQEALRLGAIDFITKVELETEKFDQVLERIYQRITRKEQEDTPVSNESYFQTDVGLALFFSSESSQKKWLKYLQVKDCFHLQQIDQKLWFCTPRQGQEAEKVQQVLPDGFNGFLVEVNGIRERFCNQVYRLLLDYKDKLFFYECAEEGDCLIKNLRDIERENGLLLQELSAVKKKFFSFQWVYEDEQLAVILTEIEDLRLPNDHLLNLFHEMVDEWNKRYPFIPSAHIERPVEFRKWNDVNDWLLHFRHVIKMTAGNGYAGDVVNSILVAVQLTHDKLQEGLTADEVAKSVNMSRSYFNKCFKDIVGKSFHQYLRVIRIEKAKRIIEQTNESLHWIAEQIGYLDEKYFSRVFREHTGLLPSEYRKKYRKGEKRLK